MFNDGTVTNTISNVKDSVKDIYTVTKNLDITLSIEEAAKLLPEKPEWLEFKGKKRHAPLE